MILKKCAFLALITMLACATFAGAQQRTKSRKAVKSKQPAKVSAPTPAASSQKPESPSQQASHEGPKAAKPGEVERITVEELKEKLAKHEPVTIIDSRSQGSYDATSTKIKGAIRIASDEVQARLKELPKDKPIVVYCT